MTQTTAPPRKAPWSRTLLDALRPPERLTISEWADRYRVLDATSSSEAGPWRTSRVPHAREWMDSVQLPWIRQITIKKSTQIAGTEAILNVLGYAVTQEPGPILYVLPSGELGEDFYNERLMPAVRLCTQWRDQLTGVRHDAKKRRVRFRRCRLRIASARVPSELSQFAARWLIGDECGKWPTWTQKEAGPWELAGERLATYGWRARQLLVSTPVLDGGLISREYAAGDRRRYFVPCPHCNRFQVLRWSQVKWPEEITTAADMTLARDAWYACEACNGRIVDEHKQRLLDRGIWIPEDLDVDAILENGVPCVPEERAEHRSYHIWAAYSPWRKWWELVAKWMQWRHDPEQLQNWVNSWLGEEWVRKVEDPRPDLLRDCVDPSYKRGQVPAGVHVLTAFADVGKRFLSFTIRGWGVDNESWLIDHGRVDTFEQLDDAIFLRPWPRGLMVRRMFIDARYRTEEVIAFCRRRQAIVMPTIGIERDDPRPFSTSKLERHPVTGRPLSNSIMAWHVNVGLFKDEIAIRLRTGRGPGPNAFHVYSDVDERYLQEMVAEHKVTVRKGQREIERWVKKPGYRQNHFWDTEVGNAAAAAAIYVHHLRRLLEQGSTGRPVRRRDDDDDDPDRGEGRRLWGTS